ncbi:uncharacterized protein NPIL_403581 [Nephila pilipes]|uniref:Uncharacterized protein n=1 Tax=Nephila pilipes TaxID=299642 RepID=A0A8X6UVQ7_NEPPI|nr:uncharacterized protein NPIL_403581 [Nephila pilipes]
MEKIQITPSYDFMKRADPLRSRNSNNIIFQHQLKFLLSYFQPFSLRVLLKHKQLKLIVVHGKYAIGKIELYKDLKAVYPPHYTLNRWRNNMIYSRKISSLKESASAQVAINLCQDNGFKEVALLLEKPTYGAFVHEYSSAPFITDTKILSTWIEAQKDAQSLNDFRKSCKVRADHMIEQWESAIGEQCQRLTEDIPHLLKRGVQAWINRIALEYLSYSRRQEVLFGMSRYFLMDVLTNEDLTKVGRLNEKKLAERFLKDDRLTILQRYYIACVYCLHVHIPRLWMGLTCDERQRLLSGFNPPYLSRNVLLWSHQMVEHLEGKSALRNDYQWIEAAHLAVLDGNRAALMSCWKMLETHLQQEKMIEMALQSVKTLRCLRYKLPWYRDWRERFVSNDFPLKESIDSISGFNLPSYYSDLMSFFLSQMDEEQQLTFFKQAFQNSYCDSVVKCFLYWPHQDDFIPTISRLWGIMPKNQYVRCLLTLASKYTESFNTEKFNIKNFNVENFGMEGYAFAALDKNEMHYYDYRSLLEMLWEETPEEYKRYLFLNYEADWDYYLLNDGAVLLSGLIRKSPCQGNEGTLFKRIFCYQPQEQRRAMMRSSEGEKICSVLIQKENWSFVNWLLEECLPKEEIRSFKQEFIQSKCGHELCLNVLKENREGLVEDLINWSLDLVEEKTQYKFELITSKCSGLRTCTELWRQSEFIKVDRIIHFCIPLDKKMQFLKIAFSNLLEECDWGLMDTILIWTFHTEEKIRHFKKELFSYVGLSIHRFLLFLVQEWENVELLYKWFELSPDEIKKFKKDTIFSSNVVSMITNELIYESMVRFLIPLRWCLTDEEMVIEYQKKIEENCCGLNEDLRKERLHILMTELLNTFREEETRDETIEETILMTNRGDKRSIDSENEPGSSGKRLK